MIGADQVNMPKTQANRKQDNLNQVEEKEIVTAGAAFSTLKNKLYELVSRVKDLPAVSSNSAFVKWVGHNQTYQENARLYLNFVKNQWPAEIERMQREFPDKLKYDELRSSFEQGVASLEGLLESVKKEEMLVDEGGGNQVLIPISVAALLLGIAPRVAREQAKAQKLGATRIGNSWATNPENIDKYREDYVMPNKHALRSGKN